MSRTININVEKNGRPVRVGNICGDSTAEARFSYFDEYLQSEDARPISISLPLQKEPFSVAKTGNFFEGLLPEGFSRRAVADWVKADENDYLTILEKLGQEFLGAILIDDDGQAERDMAYEPLSRERVKQLAAEGATRSTELLMQTHLSLTGASGKAGLYYDSENDKWYLPKGRAASTHIVKQSHVRLGHIVLNEQLCMQTAKKLGIEVPESFVINLGHGMDSDVLFATKRFDRYMDSGVLIDGLKCPGRLHQEDFSQALGISSKDKYERQPSGYLRKMFELIRNYCSDPIRDQQKLWDMIVFCFLIGNTDCHIKNFSLTYSPDLKSIKLAPAYDIVCTRVYGSTPEMSFFIGGELEIDRIGRENFRLAAHEAGIGEKLAMKRFDYMRNGIEEAFYDAVNDMLLAGLDDVKSISGEMLKVIKRRIKD
ncbi:MAG: HipA domain-containing protein [Lachnospiraceae bacterium]|nr:HipA domain-containing protein [Lachnospiraceae bacterium]